MHSAGHTILTALAKSRGLPAFGASRMYENGLMSEGSSLLLWQSPHYMNTSGVALRKAWQTFNNRVLQSSGGSRRAKLVIIHDELDLPIGKITIRGSESSARGHNGIKSVKEQMGKTEYIKIGVAVGRPESRESSQVARYVLKKMTQNEKFDILKNLAEIESLLVTLVDGKDVKLAGAPKARRAIAQKAP